MIDSGIIISRLPSFKLFLSKMIISTTDPIWSADKSKNYP